MRRDVPPGALAVSSGPQRNLEGWTLARRAGTAQAAAAAAADANAAQPGEERDVSHDGPTGVGPSGPEGGES